MDCQTYVHELKQAAVQVDSEIKACKVEPLMKLENTIAYYDFVQNGLQTFVQIEQALAEIEFLTEQHNFREASLQLHTAYALYQSSLPTLTLCNQQQHILS